PEHPGGQQPVRVDVLENVELLIFLGHEDEKFLKDIIQAFKESSQWLYPLHLGRAEDMVIIEELGFVSVEEKEPSGVLPYYAWLPEDKPLVWTAPEDYDRFFSSIYGTYHRVNTFYTLQDGIRVFNAVKTKLFEKGGFPLKPTAEAYEFPVVKVNDTKIPLIPVKIGG
ncbi:MAG: hypothetical protein DRI61_13685, partial [Chloroflexi bacterium]